MKSSKYYTRKIHRYLGIFIGIQFLLWSLGGLYFSWTDIDEIHGDHLRRTNNFMLIDDDQKLINPQKVINKIKHKNTIDSLISLKLIHIHNKPFYQIRYFSSNNKKAKSKIQLASAITGELRGPLSQKEAIRIAQSVFYGELQVKDVEFIEKVDKHHEYRERPLPVWAITMEHDSDPTAYISASLGTFQSIRHNRWRIFDNLWMLHTMDFQSRDNFNNLILRIFSLLGLITVISGYLLYYTSSQTIRKLKKRIK